VAGYRREGSARLTHALHSWPAILSKVKHSVHGHTAATSFTTATLTSNMGEGIKQMGCTLKRNYDKSFETAKITN